MAAGERGVHQVAAPRVALGHRQLVAVLDGAADLVDVREVDLRVDALGEQVHAQGDQVDVAGALAVAEQAALDPVRAGLVAQLGGGHRGAAVVVRVQAQHHRVAAVQVPVHPLDGVGVDVRGGHLHGGRQVDHHRRVRGGLPDRRHRVADLDRVLQLGAGVGLRGVLEAPVGGRVLLGEPQHVLRAVGGDLGDAGPVGPEHHPALQDRGGVVQVHDGPRRALTGLVGALDQLRAGLGQHLDRDVVRDQVLLDDLADEVEVGLAGRREADLDLLVAHPDQQLEHAPLAGRAHRVDQGLVAVPQVDRAPQRGLRDPLVGPGAVGQRYRLHQLVERAVALERHVRAALGVPRRLVVRGRPGRGAQPAAGRGRRRRRARWSWWGAPGGFRRGMGTATGARQDPRRGAGRSDPAAAAKEQAHHGSEGSPRAEPSNTRAPLPSGRYHDHRAPADRVILVASRSPPGVPGAVTGSIGNPRGVRNSTRGGAYALARVLNTIGLAIVAVIVIYIVLTLLEANPDNTAATLVRQLAGTSISAWPTSSWSTTRNGRSA